MERCCIASSILGQRASPGRAGPDQLLGTGDDEPIVVAPALWQPELNTALWDTASALTPGHHRAVLSDLRDVAGNGLATRTWDFVAYTGLRTTFFGTVDASDAAVSALFARSPPIQPTDASARTSRIPSK